MTYEKNELYSMVDKVMQEIFEQYKGYPLCRRKRAESMMLKELESMILKNLDVCYGINKNNADIAFTHSDREVSVSVTLHKNVVDLKTAITWGVEDE